MKGFMSTLVILVLLSGLAGCSAIERQALNRLPAATESAPRPYALPAQRIMAADVNITYMEAGQGPWVVLLHGGVIPMHIGRSLAVDPVMDLATLPVGYLPMAQSMLHAGAVATADTWNYNLQVLADAGYRVVALDLPGFGGSDKPDIEYKIEEFVIYLEAFMEAKGIDRASLVGHGMGGGIAIAYTLAHPERVDRLVLVDSFGASKKTSFLKLPRWMGVRLIQKEKAAKINIMLPLARRVLGNWGWPLERAMGNALSHQVENASPRSKKNLLATQDGNAGEFLSSVTEHKLEAITSEDQRKEVHAVHLSMIEVRRDDFADRLGEIQVPVLVIRGHYDPVVKEDDAKFMAAALPMGQYISYPRSGHFPMIEEADRFNQDLIFFLSAKAVASSAD